MVVAPDADGLNMAVYTVELVAVKLLIAVSYTHLTLVMFGYMIIHLILIAGVRFKAISMGRLQRIEAAMVSL